MSEAYAVLVFPYGASRSDTRTLAFGVQAYGPFDEDEADALARRLRRDLELRAQAVRLQGWSDSPSRPWLRPQSLD